MVSMEDTRNGGRSMKPHILLFEDEEILREALVQRLILEGYNVDSASNGRKGLRLFDETPGDLVVTDVLMPEIDGLEVIRTLRRRPNSPLILAMSGGQEQDLDFLVEAKEFGANEVIAKPFQLDDFMAMVHQLLTFNRHSFPTLR